MGGIDLRSSLESLVTASPGSRDGNVVRGNIQCYELIRLVGSGSFGVVYKVKNLADDKVLALKIVQQDDRFKNRELEIMKELRHENIIQLYDAFTGMEENVPQLYLVMEYIPTTIYTVTNNCHQFNGSMPLFFVKLYMYQLARALNYLHQQQICHRDIKPQNILVSQQVGVLKLCDFGSAKKLRMEEKSTHYICSRFYRAPELLFGSTRYDCTIDIWSFGCVMVEMILGDSLFTGDDEVDQLVQIFNMLGIPTTDDIISMNPKFGEMTFPQREEARSWEEIISGFEQGNWHLCDLLRNIFVYNPTQRISMLETCAHPFFDDLRQEGVTLPNGRALPPLANFTLEELKNASPATLRQLIPPHLRLPCYPAAMFLDYDHQAKEEGEEGEEED